MDSRQAKEILMRYRPGTTDDGDPEFAEDSADAIVTMVTPQRMAAEV